MAVQAGQVVWAVLPRGTVLVGEPLGDRLELRKTGLLPQGVQRAAPQAASLEMKSVEVPGQRGLFSTSMELRRGLAWENDICWLPEWTVAGEMG